MITGEMQTVKNYNMVSKEYSGEVKRPVKLQLNNCLHLQFYNQGRVGEEGRQETAIQKTMRQQQKRADKRDSNRRHRKSDGERKRSEHTVDCII
jgi:hypothetical protein